MTKKMTMEEVKKKILQMYELMGLDIDDLTEDEILRITCYYLKNLDQLEKDLLNIIDKSEDNSKDL